MGTRQRQGGNTVIGFTAGLVAGLLIAVGVWNPGPCGGSRGSRLSGGGRVADNSSRDGNGATPDVLVGGIRGLVCVAPVGKNPRRSSSVGGGASGPNTGP